MTTVYISIGNSDDKLTQAEWAAFFSRVSLVLRERVEKVHGQWVSEPASAWQNACWCVEIHLDDVVFMKGILAIIAKNYRQDSIAWAEVKETEFLG